MEKQSNMVTVFTATYNRADVLYRVFSSLCMQTYPHFEWVVIDDGSTDATEELVQGYAQQAPFPVVYHRQPNSGKHVAFNRALEVARGELFVIADSDDSFLPQALSVLVKAWQSIPAEERPRFKGVACRCYDPETNEALGRPFPTDELDSNDLDIRFKYRCRDEMWGISNTRVLREHPFPEIPGLNFFPEGVYYDTLARTYKTRYINAALRAYYRDQDNALTSRSTNRSRANTYLWLHYMNDLLDYFWNNVPAFCKAAVGVSMDHICLGHNYSEVMKKLKHPIGRFLCTLFWPAGSLLARWRHESG